MGLKAAGRLRAQLRTWGFGIAAKLHSPDSGLRYNKCAAANLGPVFCGPPVPRALRGIQAMPKRTSRIPAGLEELRRLLIFLGKKDLWIAGAWVIIFFITQLTASGVPMMFAPFIGAVAGGVIGWYVADDAVAEAGFGGIVLTILLVLACWIPVWFTDWLLNQIMHALLGWPMTFGRWMVLTFTTIFSLIASVWRSVADE